jgi:hypothetical protein
LQDCIFPLCTEGLLSLFHDRKYFAPDLCSELRLRDCRRLLEMLKTFTNSRVSINLDELQRVVKQGQQGPDVLPVNAGESAMKESERFGLHVE